MRIDGLAPLITDVRTRKICYGYQLNGHCALSPEPCPRTHLENTLNIYQMMLCKHLQGKYRAATITPVRTGHVVPGTNAPLTEGAIRVIGVDSLGRCTSPV